MNRREVPASWVFIGLFALVVIGIMAWLADVPSDNFNPAQRSLLTVADWMVKASIGAILGFAGARAGSSPSVPESS
jgi:hypothetical protein